MAVPVLKLSTPQEPVFVGDTMAAVTFTYALDGIAVNLTGATIRMTLVSDTGGTITLTSTAGGFTITTPLSGIFVLNEINRMDYVAGTYNGDLEITLADTKRYTPFLVQLYLKDDVTK